MQKREEIISVLQKYLPSGTSSMVYDWIQKHQFQLRIAKNRVSKLGDFRPAHAGRPHRISVNHNLNPYAFFVTLLHELAHLIAHKKHGNNIFPHGQEWKAIYTSILQVVLQKQIFPQELAIILQNYATNPAASSCADPRLFMALKRYDAEPSILLDDLPLNACFRIANGMVFRKGKKKRTRYLCQNLNNTRTYLVNGYAEVLPLDAK